jgi:hypothetical protein
MSLENVRKKIMLITKFGFFDWNVMPFGIKNATGTFSRTMTKVFGKYMEKKFLNFFVDDLNIHSMTWGKSFAASLICDDEIEGGKPKVQS